MLFIPHDDERPLDSAYPPRQPCYHVGCTGLISDYHVAAHARGATQTDGRAGPMVVHKGGTTVTPRARDHVFAFRVSLRGLDRIPSPPARFGTDCTPTSREPT